MFNRILELCRRLLGKTSAASSADEDRRVWVRHPSSAQTVVQPTADSVDTRLSARVRNVSRGGLNLLVNQRFEPGELISVDLPGATAQSLSTVLACVIHVNEEAGGWSLGCTFAEELSDADLAAFGAKRQKPPPPDNRTWVRFVCNVKASCQRVDDPEKKNWRADVVNISANGIGLLVDRAIEIGTLLSLDLQSPTTHSTRTMLACVVHVTTQPGGGRSLGCNFIRALSEADLKALL